MVRWVSGRPGCAGRALGDNNLEGAAEWSQEGSAASEGGLNGGRRRPAQPGGAGEDRPFKKRKIKGKLGSEEQQPGPSSVPLPFKRKQQNSGGPVW